MYQVAYYVYFISLIFASFCGLSKVRTFDTASKILCVLVCCAFLNESAAYILALKYGNNLPLYAIYSLVEFCLICFYFNRVIDIFSSKNIGIYIAGLGVTLGVLNMLFVQDIHSINSYFLLFEGVSIIGMSLFAFFRFLLKYDDLNLYRFPHFWFISILVFFWSITFLSWGLYDYINMKLQHAAWKINFALAIISASSYFCLGAVFLLYPKLQKKL